MINFALIAKSYVVIVSGNTLPGFKDSIWCVLDSHSVLQIFKLSLFMNKLSDESFTWPAVE